MITAMSRPLPGRRRRHQSPRRPCASAADRFVGAPKWIHQVISDLRGSSVATLALVVTNAEPAVPTNPGLAFGLYRLYSRIDALLFSARPDPFEKVSIEPLLSEVPVIDVKPMTKKFSDEIRREDVAAIAEHRLDVLLRFGFRILKGEILGLPTYGVWSYHHGGSRRYREVRRGFGRSWTASRLLGPSSEVLSEGWTGGIITGRLPKPSCLSQARYPRGLLAVSAGVLRKLRDVYNSGRAALDAPANPRGTPGHRLYKWPTNRGNAFSQQDCASIPPKKSDTSSISINGSSRGISADASSIDGTFHRFRRLVRQGRFWAVHSR